MRHRENRTRTTARARIAGVAAIAIGLLALPASASAVGEAISPNPWLTKPFLNMAHQGGEDEAPSNTMFALKSAIQDRGADSLELDVNLSADGQLVVIHNDTVNSTTEETRNRASGFSQVRDLTVAQIQDLDAAYSFETGGGYNDDADGHPYRGIGCALCTGTPPPGYTKADFRHPTLVEVLNAFPDTPINIEIKMIRTLQPSGVNGCEMNGGQKYCDDANGSVPVAQALGNLLIQEPYASRDDLLVVSFSDVLINAFHDIAPDVALAPGISSATIWALTGEFPPVDLPPLAAFQVPPGQSAFPGLDIPDKIIRENNAHGRGYAVHVWTNGPQDETEASYMKLYCQGADGIMTTSPAKLDAWVKANNINKTTPPAQRCKTPEPVVETPTPKTKCKKGQVKKKGKCVKKKKKRKKRKK